MELETQNLLTKSKNKLSDVIRLIQRHEGGNMYTDLIAKSFPLGMVGGSGKNTRRLNQRRDRDLERTIEKAKILTPLYRERDNLSCLIQEIESGEYERKKNSKTEDAIDLRRRKASFWNNIKSGDVINLPLGNEVVVAKKNRVSIVTTGGTKWTVSEIIGREAAKYI